MNKKKILILAIALSFLLVGCDTGEVLPPADPDSPSYNGGMQTDVDDDTFEVVDDHAIIDLFDEVKDVTSYTYEVEVNVIGTQEKFTQIFTPNAWYVDYNSSASFGYAQTLEDNYMFKYYINEQATEVYPSVYVWGGYQVLEKTSPLYSQFTIASINLLKGTMDTLEDDGYIVVGQNRFLVTDTETLSIFQYMSTYGSSISNYIVSLYVDIIDQENLIFETTLDLGAYGEIVGRFEAQDSTKIDYVNEAVLDGLVGIEEQTKISDACDLLKGNNFTINGIKTIVDGEVQTDGVWTIYCTNDYFLADYHDEYNAQGYVDFGYAYIDENVPVEIYENGDLTSTPVTSQLSYEACYEFRVDSEGNIYFVNCVGPIETESTKYLTVSSLPLTGQAGYLYIVDDGSGSKIVYEWVEQKDGTFTWSQYSSWNTSVGEFYLSSDLSGTTFYPGVGGFTQLAPIYYERVDRSDENETNFVTDASEITSTLAGSIFGWGFQESTTWQDYVTDAYFDIFYDGNNQNIESVDISLGVTASVGGSFGVQYISYNYSEFGTTSVSSLEEAFEGMLVGGNN